MIARFVRGLSSALVLLGMQGCAVTVYQPMAGLHSPVVVNPQAPNFVGTKLTVYCVQSEMLNREETRMLCRRVGRLFENQGALVETTTSGATDELSGGFGEQASQPVTSELVMELRSRQLHKARDSMGWTICLLTSTLAPCVSEESFATDVTIRGADGFLLAEESFQGRIIRKVGVGPVVGNWLLDWLWRDEDEKLGPNSAQDDLSEDLYGQLSQLTYNARVQQTVLNERQGGGLSGRRSSSSAAVLSISEEVDSAPGGVEGGVMGGVIGGVEGGVEGGVLLEDVTEMPVLIGTVGTSDESQGEEGE